MVVRITQPLHRGEDDAFAQTLFNPARDFAQQHGVGRQRHVQAMLFKRRHRQHHRRIRHTCLDIRPGHFGELHRFGIRRGKIIRVSTIGEACAVGLLSIETGSMPIA